MLGFFYCLYLSKLQLMYLSTRDCVIPTHSDSFKWSCSVVNMRLLRVSCHVITAFSIICQNGLDYYILWIFLCDVKHWCYWVLILDFEYMNFCMCICFKKNSKMRNMDISMDSKLLVKTKETTIKYACRIERTLMTTPIVKAYQASNEYSKTA